MSKGSSPRPIPNPVSFRENWDRVFKKEQDNEKDKPNNSPTRLGESNARASNGSN